VNGGLQKPLWKQLVVCRFTSRADRSMESSSACRLGAQACRMSDQSAGRVAHSIYREQCRVPRGQLPPSLGGDRLAT